MKKREREKERKREREREREILPTYVHTYVPYI